MGWDTRNFGRQIGNQQKCMKFNWFNTRKLKICLYIFWPILDNFRRHIQDYNRTTYILWHVDPFLGIDREISSYTTAVVHMYIHNFLLRMKNAMTSQNIDLSS
jgi:hypothetical protein